MEKGLEQFQKDGEDAITKELLQVHKMGGFQPVTKEEIGKNNQHKVLKYLMYLKEKRCGKIKARGCADGRKQRL